MDTILEVNIDTLVGPTHFYGGLSFGNTASIGNKSVRSNPKKAALEGLEKMKLLFDLHIPQLILPPQERPSIETLRALGFSGSNQELLKTAYVNAKELLYQASSSSAMWTANAATTTASSDSSDNKVHITIANLASHLHRSIEANTTMKYLEQLLPKSHFCIHPPLPCCMDYCDEGAANHLRLESEEGSYQIFVWGRSEMSTRKPLLYPARQTKEAQEAIMRLHKLDPKRVFFIQQNPKAIDAGVFHNDVIATTHKNLFLVHEEAYVDQKKLLKALEKEIDILVIPTAKLTLQEAVSSYFFNSQLVTIPKDPRPTMIAPIETYKMKSTYELCEMLVRQNILQNIIFVPINQSMKNGGGPACLRLRLFLTKKELSSISKLAFFTLEKYRKLKALIESAYPESFSLHTLTLKSIYRRIHEALS